jgi:hypothetical protein
MPSRRPAVHEAPPEASAPGVPFPRGASYDGPPRALGAVSSGGRPYPYWGEPSTLASPLPPRRAASAIPRLWSGTQDYLTKNMKMLGIGKLYTPNAMAFMYQDPATDSRAPDFMVAVNPGVVYAGGSKIAEHGGSNMDDRSVALLVSNPGLHNGMITALVKTTQVAPTILRALGLSPNELQSVRMEGTQELPGLPF